MLPAPGADTAELPPGPRPAPAGPAVVTAAQAEVLDRLREHHLPVTARELADGHGLHANTVREHLGSLTSRALVFRVPLRSGGRGRPSYGYSASAAPPGLRTHAVLLEALADHLAATADQPAATAQDLGRRYAAALGPAGGPGGRAVAEDPFALLTDHMARLGFGPAPGVAGPGGGDRVLRLHTCPLLDAARRHRDVVCGFHLGLARGLVDADLPAGAQVTISAFAEPGACLLGLSGASPSDPADAATGTGATAPGGPR